jgi:urocanate hydratase
MIKFMMMELLCADQVVFLDALWRGEREGIADAYKNMLLDGTRLNIQSLKNQGFIRLIDENKDGTLMNLDITDKTRELFGEDTSSDKFDEFVDAYPRFLFIDGKRVAALNADMAELEETYTKMVIKKGQHDRVLTALNWARENHEVHMGIKLWLGSMQWKSIEEIMNDPSGSRLPSNNLL